MAEIPTSSVKNFTLSYSVGVYYTFFVVSQMDCSFGAT